MMFYLKHDLERALNLFVPGCPDKEELYVLSPTLQTII